jgi:ATP-dependent DNA ligase
MSVAAEAAKLKDDGFIVDGEMVIPRPDGTCDFFALSQAVAARMSERIVFRIFDILMCEGADIRRLSLLERKAARANHTAQIPAHRLLRAHRPWADRPCVPTQFKGRFRGLRVGFLSGSTSFRTTSPLA